MKLRKIYHMGIPVDDLDRARDFYTKVLGMEYLGRVGGNPNNPDALMIHGKVQQLDRLRCGTDDVVLFERPRAIGRDALDQDGIAHQAFDMNWQDYDDALKTGPRPSPLVIGSLGVQSWVNRSRPAATDSALTALGPGWVKRGYPIEATRR